MFYVIDNFLPEDYFKELQELVIYNHRFPYYCNKGKVYESDTDYQFTHCLAIEKEIISDWYKDFIPLFQKLNAHTVERAKINLQPKTTKIERSSTHVDYEESDIKACCLYLNNNNGYTFLAMIRYILLKIDWCFLMVVPYMEEQLAPIMILE